MRITFLGQSGFAVDTGAQLLLFDYAPRRRRKLTEPLLREMLENRRCTVFVSHVHEDHFSPEIYELPNCRYVIAEGVPAACGALTVAAGADYEPDGLRIRTFDSTDVGVAFLVEADGRRIYHAGDLNWWHWADQPAAWNARMERAFLAQAAQITAQPIDLAFLTADPRQKDAWLWGFDHLMRHGRIAHAVPMHFWNAAAAARRVSEAACTQPYRDRILTLSACGESVTIP